MTETAHYELKPVESEALTPDVLEMYKIPGFDMTDTDIKRYFKRREKLERDLDENSIFAIHTWRKKLQEAQSDGAKERLIIETFESGNADAQHVAIGHINQIASNEMRTQLIKRALESNDRNVQEIAVDMIRYASTDEHAVLLEQALQSSYIETQRAATRSIFHILSGDERVMLFEKALQNNNIEIQRVVTFFISGISSVSQKEKLLKIVNKKVRQGLLSSDSKTQETATRMIPYAEKEYHLALVKQALDSDYGNTQLAACANISYFIDAGEQTELERIVVKKVKQGLKSADNKTKQLATDMIFYVPEDERTALIEQALGSVDAETQKKAAGIISYAPDNERTALIRQALGSDSIETQTIAVTGIRDVSMSERAPLITEALGNDSVQTQKTAAEMIPFAPQEKRTGLIREGLESDDIEVQKLSASTICSLLDDEQGEFLDLMYDKIRHGLQDSDNQTKHTAAEMILFAPQEKRTGLIREGLESDDIKIQEAVVQAIKHARYRVLDDEIFSLIVEKKLGGYLVKSRLYENTEPDDLEHNLSRVAFEKDDSETTLLGGNLKEKVIMRHIDIKSFLAWQRAYEGHETWRKFMFSHVPVEPIVSYVQTSDGLAHVSTGILDLNFEEWADMTNKFKDDLQNQKSRILGGLARLGIIHGHLDTNDQNFALRFFRTEDGQPDFSKPPRVYAIDFDIAKHK